MVAPGALTLAIALSLAASSLAQTTQPPPPSPPPTFVQPGEVGYVPIVINEVADKEDSTDLCLGEDWIELYNPSSSAASIEGLVLVDDKGHGDSDQLVLGGAGCPVSMGAGEFLLLCRRSKAILAGVDYPSCGFTFGIGGGDTISLHVNTTHDGYLDTTPGCCANSNTLSFGLASTSGAGSHTVLPVRTPGVANIWTIFINEVASDGNAGDMCLGEDYVELYNPLSTAVDITGLQLTDDHGLPYDKSLTLGAAGCPSSMPAGSYLVLCRRGAATLVSNGNSTASAGCGFELGIGGSDEVMLYASDGTTLIDTSGNLGDLGSSVQSQGRPTPGTAFGAMPRTPGAVNVVAVATAPPPPSPAGPPAVFPPLAPCGVVISEVAATGNAADICTGDDWIELWNPCDGVTANS